MIAGARHDGVDAADSSQFATSTGMADFAQLTNRSTSPLRTWVAIAAIFLASRALLICSAAAFASYFQVEAALPGWSDLLCRWDCIWYLSIADIGYSQAEIWQGAFAQTNYCFFPLLPLAIRMLAPVFGGNLLYAGLVFTNLCFLAALFYIYHYARLLKFEPRVALGSVALICLLPQSIAFSALLAESPFLLLLAMAIYHFRREQYLVAGIAAALLSATRANGILFVLFALAMVISGGGLRTLVTPWSRPERLIPLIFAPIGILAFLAFCLATTGDAFAYRTAADHGWNWHFYPVWDNLLTMARIGGQPRYVALTGMLTLACAALLLPRKLYPEFIFCAATIILILSGSGVVSIFRYWIVLFPVWVAVASIILRPPSVAIGAFLAIALLDEIFVFAWVTRNTVSL